jgi:hypothetical protein
MENEQSTSSQESVESWLANEGYPLEYYAADIFRSAGFRVSQGMHVRGAGDEKPREIDALASRDIKAGTGLIRCSNVIECKWAGDKPWVIFTSPTSQMANSAVIAQSIANELADALLWMIADHQKVLKLCLFDAPEAPGFGGRQAHNKNDLFYSTMASVTSAAVAWSETYSRPSRPEKSDQDLEYAVISFPIILIEGLLYEAQYDSTAERLITKSVDRVRCHWRGAPSWPFHATVDIVTRAGLPAFVKQRRKDIDALAIELKNAKALLAKAYASNDPSVLKFGGEPRGRVALPPILGKVFIKRRARKKLT